MWCVQIARKIARETERESQQWTQYGELGHSYGVTVLAPRDVETFHRQVSPYHRPYGVAYRQACIGYRQAAS